MHQTSSAPFALFRFLGRVGARARQVAGGAASAICYVIYSVSRNIRAGPRQKMLKNLGVQPFQASATQSAGSMCAKRLLRLPASASGGFTSPWKMTMRASAGTKGGFQ